MSAPRPVSGFKLGPRRKSGHLSRLAVEPVPRKPVNVSRSMQSKKGSPEALERFCPDRVRNPEDTRVVLAHDACLDLFGLQNRVHSIDLGTLGRPPDPSRIRNEDQASEFWLESHTEA